MMERTGKQIRKFSEMFDENVVIFEERSTSKFPYCDCDRCGKPIVRKMFTVQSCETGIELGYFGSECVKYI